MVTEVLCDSSTILHVFKIAPGGDFVVCELFYRGCGPWGHSDRLHGGGEKPGHNN